jgi:hypothetical protein
MILTVGVGLNALMKPTSNGGVLYRIRVIAALGAGLLFPTPLLAIQATQQTEDIGIETSVQVYIRSLRQAFGVAIGGVIFQNEFDRFVARDVQNRAIPSNLIIKGSHADSAYTTLYTLPKSVLSTYKMVYANALRTIWYVLTALSGLALIVSLVARNESLDKGLTSQHKFEKPSVQTQDKNV